MKAQNISGEFLSRLLNTLVSEAPEGHENETLRGRIETIFDSCEDIHVSAPSQIRDGNFNFSRLNQARLFSLSEAAFEKLNVLLPWSSVSEVGPGKYLGCPWSNRKRASIANFPDPLVVRLDSRLPLKDLRVLEVGCFEGHHTASLAALSKSVVAFDGRLENVVKTLVHCWLMGLEQQVRVECIDLEKNNLKDFFSSNGILSDFDLVHHRGVLYHLSDPCGHIKQISEVTAKHLYLHTQVATQDQINGEYETGFGMVGVFVYREPKITFSPFSGMTSNAVWLTKENLLEFLKLKGFNTIDLIKEQKERNGLRIELIASR